MADDQLVRRYVSNGHELRMLQSLVEQMHPRIFEAVEEGPTETDARGNLVTVDSCPACAGEWREVQTGPDVSHVFYSERLMHPCGHPDQAPPATVQPRDALTDADVPFDDPFTAAPDDDLADIG